MSSTRFHQHQVRVRGATPDAEIKTPVPGRVLAPDGGSGPDWGSPDSLARTSSRQGSRSATGCSGRTATPAAGEDGMTTAERQELRRLRRENRRLRKGPGRPGKATAWFAREAGPKGPPVREGALGEASCRHKAPGGRSLHERGLGVAQAATLGAVRCQTTIRYGMCGRFTGAVAGPAVRLTSTPSWWKRGLRRARADWQPDAGGSGSS